MFDFEFPYEGAGQDSDLDAVKDMLWDMFNSVEQYRLNSGANFSGSDVGMSRQIPTLVENPDADFARDTNVGSRIKKLVDIVVNNVPREYQNTDLTGLDLRPILIELINNPDMYGLNPKEISTAEAIVDTQTRSISNAIEHSIYQTQMPVGENGALAPAYVVYAPTTIKTMAANIAALPDNQTVSSLNQITDVAATWWSNDEQVSQFDTQQTIFGNKDQAPQILLDDGVYDDLQLASQDADVNVSATGEVTIDRQQQLESDSDFTALATSGGYGAPAPSPKVNFSYDDVQALARVNPDAIWSDALAQAQNPNVESNWLNKQFMFDPSPIWQSAGPNYNVLFGDESRVPTQQRNLLGMVNLLYDMTPNEIMALHDNLMLAGYYTQVGNTPMSKGDPSDPALKQAYQMFLSDVMQSERSLAGELQYRQKQNADRMRNSLNELNRSAVQNGANAFAQAVLGRDLQTEELDRVVRIMRSMDVEQQIMADNPFQQQIGVLRRAVESIDPQQADAYAASANVSKFRERYGTGRYPTGEEVRPRFTAEDVEQGLIQQGVENSQ